MASSNREFKHGSRTDGSTSSANGRPRTIASLADAKRLDAAWLASEFDLTNLPGGGVVIPYYDHEGTELYRRERDNPNRAGRFYQPAGVKLRPYGLWRIDEARRVAQLYLAEGESDAWALWAAGLPALGIPGANALSCLGDEELVGIDAVCVLPDNDQAGEKFWEGVNQRLKALKWSGRLYRVSVPKDVKDLSAWRARDPDQFLAELTEAVKALKPAVGPDQGGPKPLALARTLADVTARPIEWLWKLWIPLGAITLLDGDPGLGKSTITLDLAARVSRGWGMPDGKTSAGPPAGVLLLGAEDNLEYTTRPRLDAASADVSRVHALEAIQTAEGERPPVLPYDLALVEGLIAERGIRLVVVDPFMAFLDADLDAHRDQDVRRCMHRLKLLAEKCNVAILLIRHLNKLIGGPALYRGGGSIGITGAVRSALLVGKNPSEEQQCVLAPVKCNLAAKPKSLLYAVETEGETSRIGWLGETDLQADDVLVHPGGRKRPTTAEQCAAAIRDFLADGPKESEGMNAWLSQHGYSTWAIKAGRRLAGVTVRRVGFGPGSKFMAELSGPEGANDQDEDPLPP
jgi:hypothetical protein